MPKFDLQVAVVPLDIIPDNKEHNLNRVENILSSIKEGTDVVVLPELFTTGFISDQDKMWNLSETSTGLTMQLVHKWANIGGYAICGSFLAHTGGYVYNRAFFVEPSGDETFSDKRHLFSMGGEDKLLRRGKGPLTVVRFRGWNIAVAVCYDLRFPIYLRNKNLSYDALFIPANWPESRAHAWFTLLNARAIENQAYVIGANRLGESGHDKYPLALSRVFDYMGRSLNEVNESDSYPVIYSSFDAKGLTEYRERFPVWRDADV